MLASMTGIVSPSQAAEQSGFSLDTLRYSERIGLLDDIDRSPSGHRRFREHGVRLVGELSPGIAVGYLVGGAWDGVLAVTKAGGFGAPNALLDVVQALGVSSKSD